MKKLKLKALELGANEVLTRAQLKNVLGGSAFVTTMPGCGPTSCPNGQILCSRYNLSCPGASQRYCAIICTV